MRKSTGETCFNVAEYVPPPENSTRQCLQCQKDVLGKDRLSHIGRHIMLHQQGLKDKIHKEGTQVNVYALLWIAVLTISIDIRL
jgi:hypothetical protein